MDFGLQPKEAGLVNGGLIFAGTFVVAALLIG